MCSLVSFNNPQNRLELFIPYCITQIKEEIEYGASSKLSGSKFAANMNPFGFSTNADSRLHWFQSILLNVVKCNGIHILKFQDEIDDILQFTIEKCISRRGYKWAGKLLRNTINSLLTVYPIDYHAHNLPKPPILTWGGLPNLSLDYNVTSIWHIPSKEEMNFASKLLEKYTNVCVSKIEYLITRTGDSTVKSSFPKWMYILYNCLFAIAQLIELKPSQMHENETEDCRLYAVQWMKRPLVSTPIDPLVSEKWSFKTEELHLLLLRLGSFFLKEMSDDVECTMILVKCIQAIIMYQGQSLPKLTAALSNDHKYDKLVLKGNRKDMILPRYYEIKRLHLLHCKRMKASASEGFATRSIYKLISMVLDFSLSPFTLVRKYAQSSLFSIINVYTISKYEVFEKLIHTLNSKPSEDAVKGAIFILKSNDFMGFYIYNINFFSKYLLTLMDAQGQNKATIAALFLDLNKKSLGNLIISNPISSDESIALASSQEIDQKDLDSAIKNSNDKRLAFKNQYEELVILFNSG
jgi:hypothetical protein